MTDRELLEFAAKAAGLPHQWCEAWNTMAKPRPDGGFFFDKVWNPLTSDGDALRLAVKLGIDVLFTNIHSPQVHAMADAKVQVWEDPSTDPYAATRRAVVRAAAEIGRGVTQKAPSVDLPEDNYYKSLAEAEELERSKT